MRVVHSGDGYRYLTKTVAAGDGRRDLSTPLTRYYTATGTPPGYWLGTGTHDLGAPTSRTPTSVDDPVRQPTHLRPGDEVTEDQLARLLGQGRDPITGMPLGKACPDYGRSTAATGQDGRDGRERADRPQTRRKAVAGFDFTFSVPKSLSVLWAVSDARTQALIAQAHHEAIADVIALIERDVAATRTGTNSHDGPVAQVAVTGVIATAFDHYDSRSGDPNLHTHVVVSNKVRTVFDGKWRSLDSRPIHRAVVALSEHYNAILADKTTLALGVEWEQRERGRDRNPAWEITGVSDELVEHFSNRGADIEAETDRLIDQYVHEHGHQPSKVTILKLRQQATLATRPDKTVRPLSDLTADWRTRAESVLGTDPTAWARDLTGSATETPELLQTRDIDAALVETIAANVVEAVAEKRSTWRRWNLHAEASRATMGLRFATAHDRQAVTRLIVAAAERLSVRLTPPETPAVPGTFQRGDGTSVFRPADAVVYTSAALLAAEDELLRLTGTDSGPKAAPDPDGGTGRDGGAGVDLSGEQAAALGQVAVSGRTVDVLMGAAGAGKTSTMRALRVRWEAEHGAGRVVGLAPSARAADVLASDLGIACENTAKWLHEHRAGRWRLRPGQLVILDEASLASTPALHEIAAHAAEAGAKVLLVGDPAQLGAVGAGGAFALLAAHLRESGGLAELLDVRRFRRDWEKTASLRLRDGDPDVLAAYGAHGRLTGGTTDDMTEAAYQAWRDDLAAGKTSVLLAETAETVTALNQRARADRIRTGEVDAESAGTRLHDGTSASAGDLIVTRRNDRRLIAGTGFVRNGDTWTVLATGEDGSTRVCRARAGFGVTVTLPAAYVAEHVELAYATTVHRSQGITVDTAHALIASDCMTLEALYVAMTRGRVRNTAYVATDQPGLEPHQRTSDGSATAVTVLTGVLRHKGTEPSAHQAIRDEQEHWTTIAQLAAEYETIAADAQRDRWQHLIRSSLQDPATAERVCGSPAFGALTTQLRSAEADGYDVDVLLPTIANTARGFGDADDPAAVLHHRLTNTTARQPSGSHPRRQRIAGLIPEAAGPMTAEHRQALDERREMIKERARTLAAQAVRNCEPWTTELGQVPRDPERRKAWLAHAVTVAAYRDRYGITALTPLGTSIDTDTQRADAHRARAALEHARALARSLQRRPQPDLHYGRGATGPDGPGYGPRL